MNPARIETPLAQRFAAALAETEPGRTRLPIEHYSASFNLAEPGLLTSPDRRARLAAAIEELIEAGVLRASRVVDRSELPALPRFVVLLDRVADPPVGRESAGFPWRPELAWAARLPLRRSEFEALLAIQLFLRDQAPDAPIVPTGERSLEIFGDEKRLDTLMRNRRLFSAGRLSASMLKARIYAPPFAYSRIGSGPVALVLENVATYHSALATIPHDSPVGLVVFGAGGNFSASVCYLAELATEGPAASIREIRYFGDLDRRGLEIPISADAAASAAGLPSVRPAVGLWARLLKAGRRSAHPPVDPQTADRLSKWLPMSLRAAAREVLVSGARLAQEAVGTKLLGSDPTWATWAALGPPSVERAGEPQSDLHRSVVKLSQVSVPGSIVALTKDDHGQEVVPDTETAWNTWAAVGETRNWVLGDPILDWLQLHGARAGLLRDDQRSDYDPRADFHRFVSERGVLFRAAVMRFVGERIAVVQIAQSPEDARSLDKARETVEAMRSGAPVVSQAVLRNPSRKTYGVVDLLVRSDLLALWFPELLSSEEAAAPAPGLHLEHFHYRPADIEFHTFELTSDGHVGTSADQLAYAVQIWLHTEALGRLQEYTPPAGYLLGRTWAQGENRGEGCFERLGRVDLDRWLPHRDSTLADLAENSVDWVRRLHKEGADWQLFPEPSVGELYPHARNPHDAPWHLAKREIAQAIGELTLLPAMNPVKRAAALCAGIRSWRDERVSAASLGITSPAYASRTDAVLAANRSLVPTVIPSHIEADSLWRTRTIEFCVDFETVNNLDDDFSNLPRCGGLALIVQIGCGQMSADGNWRFSQFTVDALTIAEERRIIDAWINHMSELCAAAGLDLSEARIYHWSAAEPVNLEDAYNSARSRHPGASWPVEFPWFDLLERVIRAEPVSVTGAFNFGLKAFAKAMHAAQFISTVWSDGPMDGLGVMAATWAAAREAQISGVPLSAHPLILAMGRYNEVDCRALAEILSWLRQNR